MVAVSPRPFTDPNIESFDITAEANGSRYEVRIGLPATYRAAAERSYPILVMLDADAAFGTVHEAMVNSAMWSLAPVGRPVAQVPEFITVGISLPDRAERPLRRNFEYMPDTDQDEMYERPNSYLKRVLEMVGHSGALGGGASIFQAVLRDEILPLVESLYRVSSDRRMLLGCSAGGSFCCHTLFTQPDLFTHYVIVSPGILTPKIFDLEAAWAASHDDLAANVFLSAGQLELSDPLDIAGNTMRLVEQLNFRAYPGLRLHSMFFPEAGHVDTIAPSISLALKRFFA